MHLLRHHRPLSFFFCQRGGRGGLTQRERGLKFVCVCVHVLQLTRISPHRWWWWDRDRWVSYGPPLITSITRGLIEWFLSTGPSSSDRGSASDFINSLSILPGGVGWRAGGGGSYGGSPRSTRPKKEKHKKKLWGKIYIFISQSSLLLLSSNLTIDVDWFCFKIINERILEIKNYFGISVVQFDAS